MTRTVLAATEPTGRWRGRGACGFCSTATAGGVKHELCPESIQDAAGAKGSVWHCACARAGHNSEGISESRA